MSSRAPALAMSLDWGWMNGLVTTRPGSRNAASACMSAVTIVEKATFLMGRDRT
jgi:hypothetical protein